MEMFIQGSPITALEVLYTLLFVLCVICTVYPPLEFIAAGVTLENIFGRILGSENILFFEYHLRRTSMVRVIWSCYALLYYCIMRFLSDNVVNASPNWHPPFSLWDCILWLGIGLVTAISMHTYLVWYNGGTWSGHPAVRSMEALSSAEPSSQSNGASERWRSYVSSINAECRHPDNFVASQGSLASSWSGRRLIVTDTWILASHFTQFRIIRQNPDNLRAVVVSTSSILDTGAFTEGGRPAGESLGTHTMVTVNFVDVRSGLCVLSSGMAAANLDTLRTKLQCPLINAEGVHLEPTIVQRFVEAFSQIVNEQDPIVPDSKLTYLSPFRLPSKELESCIGCMSHTANVMLSHRCDPTDHAAFDAQLGTMPRVPPCGHCRCRPMWCLECMARWFASRQTELHRSPSTWLSGRSPCPTCRTVFCVRDVVRLKLPVNEST